MTEEQSRDVFLFNVFDANGRLLASFEDLDTAHEWAHGQRFNSRRRLPLEIDDRAARATLRVDRTACEMVYWVDAKWVVKCA